MLAAVIPALTAGAALAADAPAPADTSVAVATESATAYADEITRAGYKQVAPALHGKK